MKVKIQTDSNNHIIPQGIDLSDSFILNWTRNESEFEIELDLSIWPESPYYSKPIKGEFTCYKRGILRFYGTTELNGFIELESVEPNIDANGSKDWDCIYDLKKENEHFTFKTEFADIQVKCDRFEIELTE